MQYYELTHEEIKILNSFEKNEFESSASKKSDANYRNYAKNHLAKSKNVNIRLGESDILKLKGKAAEEGLPYQTLMASVLHKYAEGNLIPKV